MSRVSNTSERVRQRLPSDTRLWLQRHDWSPTSFAMAVQADMHLVRKAVEDRGWRMSPGRARKRIHLTHAPCRVCGQTFEIDGQRERVCSTCTPPAPKEPWREEFELERAKQEAKRRVRREAISAMTAKRLAELEANDPDRGMRGRKRKGRAA
jgi:hypothetical protein